MFDIEYYQKQSDRSKDWYSEIDCLPLVEGIAYFLKDSFKNKDFIFEDFVKDADEIQEIRGLLYERYNNKPQSHSWLASTPQRVSMIVCLQTSSLLKYIVIEMSESNLEKSIILLLLIKTIAII